MKYDRDEGGQKMPTKVSKWAAQFYYLIWQVSTLGESFLGNFKSNKERRNKKKIKNSDSLNHVINKISILIYSKVEAKFNNQLLYASNFNEQNCNLSKKNYYLSSIKWNYALGTERK